MNKDLLVKNIEYYCKEKKIKPTPACAAAGVGKNFVIDIKRGQTPSVAKVADLAAYLGVSTSDLVGDTRDPPDAAITSPEEKELLRLYRMMNDEGRERLLDTADDMVHGGKYIKSGQIQLGNKESAG